MTDLEWITDGRQLAAVVLGRHDDGSITDLAIMDCAPRGPVARLSLTAEGRLLINGQDEEREDALALLGAFDEAEDADLPAGSVIFLGTWDDGPGMINRSDGPDYSEREPTADDYQAIVWGQP